MSEWISVKKKLPLAGVQVDVWLRVSASPLSFGFSDEWRVPDAYLVDGKWFHSYKDKPTEIRYEYVTHWINKPGPPK